MHLFNLVSFGERFGVDLSVTDFDAAVRRASIAATEDLAAQFRYETFGLYTGRVDVFNVERTFGPIGRPYNRFLLSRGFTTKANVTAYYTTTPLNFTNLNLSGLTNLKNISEDGASDVLTVDGDRGVVTVHSVELADYWVVLSYSGGFTTATDDEFEAVPGWLSQVAMAKTAINLARHPAFTPTDEGGAVATLDELKHQVRTAWQRYSRYVPDAMHPAFSYNVP